MLNEGQKKTLEENHNLIYKFIISHGLNVEEYYDLFALALCLKVEKYDKKRAAFSTFAYNVMENCLKNEIKRVNRNKVIPKGMTMAIVEDEKDNGIFETQIYKDSKSQNFYFDRNLDVYMCMKDIEEYLDEKELKIVKLLLDGITQAEISKEINCTQQHVANIIKKIRKKLKNYIS